jgi:hypothetical protein
MLSFLLPLQVSGAWLEDNAPAMPANFSCPFAMVGWNCVAFRKPQPDANAVQCARLRYVPDDEASFARIDPLVVLRRWNGSTVYFDGDSVTIQHYVEFCCRLLPFIIGQPAISRQPTSVACNTGNVCHPNHPMGPIKSSSATFGYGSARVRVVALAQVNDFRYSLFNNLRIVKSGDVIVANHGLHGSEASHMQHLTRIMPALQAARARGVSIIWRETTASNFADCPGGLRCAVAQRKQPSATAQCGAYTMLNVSLAWTQSTNERVTALMRANGIPILRVWNATFTAPPECHIGGGRDCVHFCIPGPLGYLVDALLFRLATWNETR